MPVFTQNVEFPFAFGILGVAWAAEAVRLMSTVHGAEADPQVLLALHRAAGLGSEQAYLLPLLDCAWPPTELDSKKIGSKSELDQIAKLR
jgi:hypothetical protein